MMSGSSRVLAIAPLLLVAIAACTSPNPEAPATVEGDAGEGDAGASFEGRFDASGSLMVLQRIEAPGPEREPVLLELLGSDVEVDPAAETVGIDVAIRNADRRTIYPPVLVRLRDFRPETVTVVNPDAVDSTVASTDRPEIAFVFDYSELVGEDGLAPGQVSGGKRWVFHDPGLDAFAFNATAAAGFGEASGHIAGAVFWDRNANGVFDDGDEPAAGTLNLRRPDGMVAVTHVDRSGHYGFPVRTAGLFRVTFHPFPNPPLCFHPPAPLQVVLPAGPDGAPRSFEHADFPLACPLDALGVEVTELEPDEIDQDAYELIEAHLRGDLLTLRVGFSGCSDDHPFTLWASRRFEGHEPPRTWVLLAHDDRGELCEAYWRRTLEFDLDPIRRAIIDEFGEPRPAVLLFRDFEGRVVHEFEFGP